MIHVALTPNCPALDVCSFAQAEALERRGFLLLHKHDLKLRLTHYGVDLVSRCLSVAP